MRYSYSIKMFDDIPTEFLDDCLYNKLDDFVEVKGTESIDLKHPGKL